MGSVVLHLSQGWWTVVCKGYKSQPTTNTFVSTNMWSGLTFLLVSGVRADIKIITNSDTSLVKEGAHKELSCSSDKPWFQCQWLGPRGGKTCAIAGKSGEVCSGIEGVQLKSEAKTCSVVVSAVGREHRGNWTCVLQDGEELSNDRKVMELEVGSKARVEIAVVDGGTQRDTQPGPLVYGQAGNTEVEDGVRLRVGDTVRVECKVQGANPKASVRWRGPRIVEGFRNMNIEQENGEGTGHQTQMDWLAPSQYGQQLPEEGQQMGDVNLQYWEEDVDLGT